MMWVIILCPHATRLDEVGLIVPRLGGGMGAEGW